MGKPVQHESPDYSYQPAGLMAEEWGKTGHRTEVEPYVQKAHERDRHYMDDDAGRDAMEWVWSLDDATILGARLEGSPEHIEAWRRLGTVNGLWIASRAAETAYYRGLIGERELDRIMDEA